MAKSPTAYLALQLPVPGSKEPFRVEDVVEWFTILDTKHQTTDGAITAVATRATAIEKFTLPSAAAGTPGVIPAGTTAQRNAYWSEPGTPEQRVALANKIARWYNTEKGYEEQYFAAYNDATIGPLTPAKATAKWAPVTGRALLSNYTISSVGGTAQKHGGVINLAAVTTIRLDGVFTDDFDQYEVLWDISSATADNDMTVRLRNAGVDETAAAGYGTNRLEVTSASGIVNTYATGSSWLGPRCANSGGMHARMLFTGAKAARRSLFMSDAFSADGTQRRTAGTLGTVTSYDSVSFIPGGGISGNLRVFGIAS